ncbi:MAG: Late competence development protein ComFB [Oscillospiraceae bacterium]|jgi:competence protein ComFB
MDINNAMEDLVQQKLDEIIDRLDCCQCEQCREDMILYALNRLSPKYVSTDLGRAYAKLDSMSNQFEIDLLTVLYEAAEKVKKNPRHNVKK